MTQRAGLEAVLGEHVHGAQRAALLVAVRGVDHDRQLVFLGELDLGAQVAVLERRLLVVAELAHRDDALLDGKARQDLHHGFGQRLVVRLLRVEPDGAVVADAELAGAKALEAGDERQIIEIGVGAGARLAEPEGRLDDGDDAGPRHRLVVVGRARDHVRVRIDDHGAGAEPRRRRTAVAGPPRGGDDLVDHLRRERAAAAGARHDFGRRFRRRGGLAGKAAVPVRCAGHFFRLRT